MMDQFILVVVLVCPVLHRFNFNEFLSRKVS